MRTASHLNPVLFHLVLLGMLLVSGSVFAGLSGSASMRIDVEVYKGPLSKEPFVQAFELYAKVEDAKRSFLILRRNVEISIARLGCGNRLEGVEPKPKREIPESAYKYCVLLQETYVDAQLAAEKARELIQKAGNQELIPFDCKTGGCGDGFLNTVPKNSGRLDDAEQSA